MASILYEKVPLVRNPSTSLQTVAVATNIYSLVTWSLRRNSLVWGVKTRECGWYQHAQWAGKSGGVA